MHQCIVMVKSILHTVLLHLLTTVDMLCLVSYECVYQQGFVALSRRVRHWPQLFWRQDTGHDACWIDKACGVNTVHQDRKQAVSFMHGDYGEGGRQFIPAFARCWQNDRSVWQSSFYYIITQFLIISSGGNKEIWVIWVVLSIAMTTDFFSFFFL